MSERSPADPLGGQTALVTGASGFLGSALVRRLTAAGARVVGTSRAGRRDSELEVSWWEGALDSDSAARGLVGDVRPDVIYHFAGRSTAAPDLELVGETFESLLASTVRLLTAASEIGCRRIVLAASLTEPRSGDNEAVPASPYAAAKWAASTYARMFHTLYGTPVVLVRPYLVYGPGQDRRKLVPYAASCLLRGEAPKLAGGRLQADWVYIDDVVEGFAAAGWRAGIEGKSFDLGWGDLVSVREVVEKLVALVGVDVEPDFGALPERPHEAIRIADADAAERQLGWTPRVSLDEGLARTIAWVREWA